MTNTSTAARSASAISDNDWWRGAVLYQIYPRSYQDSSGDGVGDLKGITRRLPYIASLNVDAVWISPFSKSPMKDFGYDVSDYKDVDPMFGSLADFDALISEAHRLNLKIIIDLVISHTSDQHEWFKESRSSKDNAKHDWYVWADAKPDGTVPNNWLSIFGGPAWTWETTRQQYYMHNFLTSQPDLNFHNPDVQDAVLDAARFWLDRGVDGFRLDTVNFYFCDKALRDNPPLAPEDRNADTAPAVNPYNHQNHVYDKSQPENLAFLERFRAVLDEYDARTSVGEVGDSQLGMQLLSEYTQGDNRLHMCYTFDFLSTALPTAQHTAKLLNSFKALGDDHWVCWAFSNHDVERHASRWSDFLQGTDDPQAARLKSLKQLCALILSFDGTACLYQGEELGFGEADVPFDRLQDPYGIKFWPKFKGRDGCRTPMAWEQASEHAGFSTTEPWLPVGAEHLPLAVDAQDKDTDSLLNHYRRFIALRQGNAALRNGELQNLEVNGDVLSFERVSGNERVTCYFNLGSSLQTLQLGTQGQLHNESAELFTARLDGDQLTLEAFDVAIVGP